MIRTLPLIFTLTSLVPALAGCAQRTPEEADEAVASASSGDERVWPQDDRGRCDTSGANREVSEYDTSGDDHPDVRKVFAIVGEGPAARMVLICREADLNDDGYKDVVRRYNEEGRPVREEADRDFDGRIDEVTLYDDGQIVERDTDSDSDGRIDIKTYYDDHGHPQRTERDVGHHSTPQHWQPDRWEYYDGGRTVRVGSDLDGDGRVDRWDRDSRQRDPRARGTDTGGVGGDDTVVPDDTDSSTPAEDGSTDQPASAAEHGVSGSDQGSVG